MANRNTQGFGLIAAGTLGSTPATSGQGKSKIAVKKTKILAVSLLIQLHPHIISDFAPLRVNEIIRVLD